MHPSALGAEVGKIHVEEMVAQARRPLRAGRARADRGSGRRRGLGEQLEALRRRLEIGRTRRSALSLVQMGRYTGARV